MQSTSVGVQATASDYSIAIGALSKTSAAGAIAIGGATTTTSVGAQAAAADSIAVGSASSVVAAGTSGIAIGKGATVNGVSGIAQGVGAISGATGQNVAIGSSANANSLSAAGGAVAIGLQQTATGDGAVAIGDPNVSNGTGAVTVGANNTAAANLAGTSPANGAVAIGNNNKAIGQGSVAVGNTSNAAAAGAVALGDTAVANNTNDVALGSKSTTAAPHTGTTAQFGGVAAGVQAAASTNGVVSVGAAGKERQIQNVAAGVISATSTDAINGSQLSSVVTGVNNLGTTAASTLGGGATYSPATGNISGFSQPINSVSATGAVTGPTAQTTVAAALTALNTNVGNTANIAVKYDAVGGTKITLGATGGAGAGAPVTITNLASATLNATSTDAVNGSQLFATNTTLNNISSGAGIKYFHANSALADSAATGTNSVAVGPAASSTATNAVALGNGATASTANSVALGSGATTAAATATASGVINGTTYTYAGTAPVGVLSLGSLGNERQLSNVAAGKVSTTSTDAVNGSQLFSTNTAVNSLGTTLNNISSGAGIKYFHANSALADSAATGTDSVAVGPAASSTATNAVALGNGATASTANSVALGSGATTAAATATASGVINGTTYTYAGTAPVGVLSLGSLGNERQLSNVAAGKVSTTSTDAVNGSQLFSTNTAVNSLGTTLNNISSGAGIKYFHANSALADSAATGTDSVAVGPAASSTATNAVALGNGATASTANSVALGSGATTAAATATASGVINGTTYTYAGTAPVGVLSLGSLGNERQLSNVAAGKVSTTSTDAVNGSQLFSTNTAVNSLGTTLNNISSGAGIKYFHANSALADSAATGTDSVAVGPAASSTATNAVALGNGATASTANSVALGSGATTAAATATASGVINGTTYTYAGTAPVGVLSLGSLGNERQLSNVAAGKVSTTSTDAVNGSQLFSTNTAVNSLGTTLNNISSGAGIKYFHANSALADSSATGTDSVAVGPAASSTAANAVALGNGATASTANSVALGSGATTAAATATASGVINGTTYTYAGTAPVGVLSLGSLGNERQLSNVAAGKVSTTSTDAVNGSQLFSTNTAVNSLGTTLNNISSGAGIKYFHANSALADSAATGTDSVAVGPAASSTATNAVALGNGATASTANSVALGSGATTAAATATASGVINGTTYTYAGTAPVGVLSLGSLGNERQLSNVAAGKVSATSTDAVNGSQLFSTNTAVNSLGTTLNNISSGAGIKYFHANSALADSSATGTDSVAVWAPAASSTAANAVALGNGATAGTANSVALGSGSFATGTTLGAAAYGVGGTATTGGEVNVANGANGRRITGLAAGANATDAVNVSQLNKAAQDTAAALGGNAAVDAATGAWTGPSYTTSRINASGANIGAFTVNNVGAAIADLNTSVVNTADVAVKYDDAQLKNQVTFNPTGTAVKLTNVAAGNLSATSTDAVNGSQLFGTNTQVSNLGTATASNLGGGAVYDPITGTVSAPSYTVQGSQYNNVGGAIGAVDGGLTSLNNNISNGSVGVVQRTSTVDEAVLTAAGGTAAAPGAAQKLTNLAAGTLSATSTDAVNGSQLFGLGSSVATNLGGGAAYDPVTGTVSAPSYTVQGSQYNNVGGAIGAVDGGLTSLNNNISNGSVGVVQRTSTADEAVLTAAGGTAATPGAAQKLTNLAAGTLSATSTDAVNGSQLFGTNTQVSNLGTATASNLGGGAVYDPVTGTVSAPSYTVQGSQYNNVGGAIGAVDGGLTSLNNNISNGSVGVVQRTSTADETVLTAAGGTAATPGAAQKLTNLAAGTLSATSTDAVNGSQLFGTNTQVSNLGTATASNLGGGAVYDPITGTVSAPSYTVQGSQYNNVGGAIGAVDGGLTSLNNNISNGSVGVVQRTSTVDEAVLTAAGGTAAAPGAAQKLTNLAAGTLSATSTDAVNGSQLFGLGSSVATNLGGGAAYDSVTGTVSAPSYTVQGSQYNNVGGAIGAVDGGLTSLNNNISNGSVGVVQRTSTADEAVLTAAGGTAATPGAAQKLTNLAAGTLSATSTDAVNGSQLFGTNTQVSNLGTATASNLGGGAVYDPITGTVSAPSYTVQGSQYNNVGGAIGAVDGGLTSLNNNISNGSVGVVQRTSTVDEAVLTAAGGTAAAPGAAQKLTNLAAGTLSATSTDAVNGSQLFGLGSSVATNLGGGAAYDPVTGTVSAPSYTVQGSQYNNVGGAIGAVDGGLTSLNNNISNGSVGVVQRTSTADEAVLTAAGGTAATPGAAQKLTNLAAGTLSATSTDAVNGSQLFGTNTQVSNLGTATASNLGGGAVYDPITGTVSAPSYTVQGSQYNNVGGAIGAVDGGLTSLNNNISNGSVGVVQRTSTVDEAVLTAAGGTAAAPGAAQKLTNLAAGTLSATSTDAVNGSQLFGLGSSVATNLGGGAAYDSVTGTVSAPSYTVQGSQYNNVGGAIGAVDGGLTSLNNNISNGSVGVVQRTSTADETVLTAAGGTAASPGAAQTLTNLAAGTLSATSTDAVNGSQLFGTNTQVSNLGAATASNLGGGAVYDPVTGTVSAPSYTVQGSQYNNVGGAIGAVDGSLTSLTSVVNSGLLGVVQRIGADETVLTAAGGTAAAPGVAQKLTNLAAGTVSSTSTDAVNGSQLFGVQSTVNSIQNGTDGMFQVNNSSLEAKPAAIGVDSVAGGAGAIATGSKSTAVGSKATASGQNSLAVGSGANASATNGVAIGANSIADRANSVSVGSAGNERQIINVAAATQGTDAVNLDQLKKTVSGLTDSANAYTDQRYSQLKSDLKNQDQTLSAGIAGAMAMASLPQPYSKGASMTSVAVANYRGQSAVSFGLSKISDDGKWVTKLQANTNTKGDMGVALAVGYRW
ncbi:hypothetical protein K2E96_16250 [Pseudomonas sp. ERGC3:05]|nr:hypothetical protein K2E96_16250 [Pseudomonas sp. ERGC3:05]